MFKKIILLLVCLAYMMLTGCGTKKALYLPEQRYPQESNKQIPHKAAPNDMPKTNSDTPATKAN